MIICNVMGCSVVIGRFCEVFLMLDDIISLPFTILLMHIVGLRNGNGGRAGRVELYQ